MSIQNIAPDDETGGMAINTIIGNYVQAEISMQTDHISELNIGNGITIENNVFIKNNLGITGLSIFNNDVQINANLDTTGVINSRNISLDGINLDNHIASISNPHFVTLNQIKPSSLKGDILIDTGTTMSVLPLGTTGQILTVDQNEILGVKWNNNKTITFATIKDVKSTNTNGGTFTNEEWITRDLNILNNIGNTVDNLISNTFTLINGLYFIQVSAPAYGCGGNKIRLFNITDNEVVTYGTSEYSTFLDLVNGIDTTSRSTLSITINITDTKTFRIEHRCEITQTDNGFGRATGWGDEVYTVVNITKYS